MAENKPQGTFARLMSSGNTAKAPAAKTAEAPSRGQKQGRSGQNNKESHIDCHITILQSDTEQLRKPTYAVATFRLAAEDIEWVKDAAYTLSKEVKPRKVSQSDIVRLSFKLLERVLEKNKQGVIDVLQSIK